MFETILKSVIKEGSLKERLDVSDKLHEFEAEGKDLSPKEERLWFKLTESIEEEIKEFRERMKLI